MSMRIITAVLCGLCLALPVGAGENASLAMDVGSSAPEDSGGLNYPSIKGIGLSVFPGIVLHGSGHYFSGQKEAGKDLMLLEGISLGAGIGGLIGMGLLGGAGTTAPIIFPITMFGGATFVSTWIMDVLGTAGIGRLLTSGHPLQRSWFEFHHVRQNDNQSYLFSYLGLGAQMGRSRHFLRLETEYEESRTHQSHSLTYGWKAAAGPCWEMYLIPEMRRDISKEGFSLSKADASLFLDLNLERFFPSLKNVYWENRLGYGLEWFGFGENSGWLGNDFSQGIMRLSQGFRAHFGRYVAWQSKWQRRKDELIGGQSFMLFTYRHALEFTPGKARLRLCLTHGQGYRFKSSVGIQL